MRLAEIARMPVPATCAFCPANLVESITPARTTIIAATPPSPLRISTGFILAIFFIAITIKYKEAAIASNVFPSTFDLNLDWVNSIAAFIATNAPIRTIIVLVAPSISPLALARFFSACTSINTDAATARQVFPPPNGPLAIFSTEPPTTIRTLARVPSTIALYTKVSESIFSMTLSAIARTRIPLAMDFISLPAPDISESALTKPAMPVSAASNPPIAAKPMKAFCKSASGICDSTTSEAARIPIDTARFLTA